jgi:hypothetical protein
LLRLLRSYPWGRTRKRAIAVTFSILAVLTGEGPEARPSQSGDR